MEQLVMFAVDIVAISILAFGLYFPRHRRRDLVVAYLGVNVGVLAVAGALSQVETGLGFGLGLFGVLSIIRLRSTELDQTEVAYYFSSLALGLLGGLGASLGWIAVALMGLILIVLFIGDLQGMFRRYRQQIIIIDAAISDEAELRVRLEQELGGRVHRFTVQRLDLVNDTTNVDVRYEVPKPLKAEARRQPFEPSQPSVGR